MIDPILQDAIIEAVGMSQRHSGRDGAEVVRQILSTCRIELEAAVGRPAAVVLLRNLAAAIEAGH